jgi:hypothetical protein
MKLFTDSDHKKRFMKTWLPVMVGIAWAPIIWILLIPLLSPILYALSSSWPFTQGVILLIVLFATYLLLKLFRRLGTKFYSNNQ